MADNILDRQFEPVTVNPVWVALVTHSDRGRQYASDHYQRSREQRGITCSMSRRGDCWANAAMESSFASLKKEWIHQENYQTRAEARASVFE